MDPLRRMLITGALALLAVFASIQSGSTADPKSANAALLDQYLADVNAYDVAALKDAIAANASGVMTNPYVGIRTFISVIP
jgi:hypothetical protein